MGRKKIPGDEKCNRYSISVIPAHNLFIRQNPDFSLSSFVKLQLHDYINKYLEIKTIEKGVLKNGKKTTK